jgi:tripartite-type tricarboxylate transporter receptor subunit TctC
MNALKKYALPRHVHFTMTLVLAALIAPMCSNAADYPVKPITLIVPFAAGGPTDTTARLFAKEISTELGQPVIVDNRPGAGGMTGGGAAARATRDGHTLLWGGTSTLAVAPSLFAKLPYDPLKSFQPVSRAVRGPLVLVVNAKLPINTMADLVKVARKNPGKLNYGSAGVGSIIHLTGEMLRFKAGIDIVHVPYKGNGQVMTDLSGGTLQLAFVALGHMLPHMQDGAIRPIAITSVERNPLVPDLPTVAEAFPGFESMEWFGLVAPTGIPPEALNKLNLAFRHASNRPELRQSIAKLGYLAVDESPEEFSQAIRTEGAKWREVVTQAKVHVE